MPSLNRRVLTFALASALSLRVLPALAAGEILTLRGQIAGGKERRFTLGDLEALPSSHLSTATPWNPVASSFTGVGLDALLAFVGASGTRLRLVALNDYVVEAQIVDLAGKGAVLAYRENDRTMDVGDKGPLFLIFPFDSDPGLRHQSIYARCVWQLASIDVF